MQTGSHALTVTGYSEPYKPSSPPPSSTTIVHVLEGPVIDTQILVILGSASDQPSTSPMQLACLTQGLALRQDYTLVTCCLLSPAAFLESGVPPHLWEIFHGLLQRNCAD